MEGGRRIRTRTCTRPKPQAGGDQCQGQNQQTSSCGKTCFHLAIFDFPNLVTYAIDEPGILDLQPKLPSAEEMESKDGMFSSTPIPWNNGIIFCPESASQPCQHWDFKMGSWTQMDTRPYPGVKQMQLEFNGKRFLAGGKLGSTKLR